VTKALLARAPIAALLLLTLPACKLDENAFYKRVFKCDTAAPDPACGTDVSGQKMGCFAARQIGATDFCTKTCDPAAAPTATNVCLPSGLELATCNPQVEGACGTSALGCLRTDLLRDEGVCTTLAPCSKDEDCHDPVRSVCATSFVRELYDPVTPTLKRDHMFCMQIGCKERGTSCSPGESCLRDVIPAAAHPPDICVPNCDSNLRCPPNYLCYRKISTPLAPAVCIPGLLGFTCESSIDCLVGDCTPTGIGYKVCTTTCDTQADCERFDSEQGKFVCIKNEANPTVPGVCQTPDSYRGTVCASDADCKTRNPNEVCHHFDPSAQTGNCLLPCDGEGKCPVRGGISHTCLPASRPDEGPVCFPGYFGYPCRGDGNCTGTLSCRPTLPGKPSVCSIGCTKSADCAANKWVGPDAWCVPLLNVCLPRGDDGDACLADDGCKSGHCNAVGTATAKGDDPDGGAPAPMTTAAPMKVCGPAQEQGK
jgi:hypothetical protein